MKAGKAYISSLGTTGLLLALSVLLLVVVGTLVAFDRWPAGSGSDGADSVVIGAAERVSPSSKPGTARSEARDGRRRAARRPSDRRRGAAARRAAAGRAAQSGAGEAALPADPVISGLPAPDSAIGDGRPGGSGGAAGTDGGGSAHPGTGGPSATVGDTVSGVDLQAGQAVGEVGQTAEEILIAPVDTVGAGLAP